MSDEDDEIEAARGAGRRARTEVAVGTGGDEDVGARRAAREPAGAAAQEHRAVPVPALAAAGEHAALEAADRRRAGRRRSGCCVCVAVRATVEGSPGADDVYRVGTRAAHREDAEVPATTRIACWCRASRARAIDEFTADGALPARPGPRARGDGRPGLGRDRRRCTRNVAQQFAALVAGEPAALGRAAGARREPRRSRRSSPTSSRSNLELDVARQAGSCSRSSTSPTRLRRVLDQLAREREALKVESEIREKVQSEMGKTQRDYVLRQQLEAIRQELGESEDDRARGRAAARSASRPPACPRRRAKQARRELERLAQHAAGGGRARRDPHLPRVAGATCRGRSSTEDRLDVERRARASSTRTTTASRRSRSASSSTSRCSR